MTTVQAVAENAPLTRIPEALAGLWRRCRPDHDDVSLSRALTMNLVAVTRRETEECLHRTLADIAKRQPCRAFFVAVDETRPELTADVSGESRRQGSCQEIVLERVELRGGFDHFANLASVVRPLLVNDLPVHLYWATSLPPDEQCLRLLARMADCCILDSALLADPRADRPRFDTWVDGRPVQDLTWMRLRPWRRALAEAFEHMVETGALTNDARTEVTVKHGPGTAARAGSILLAQWLERRLEARTRLEVVDAPERRTPEILELRRGEARVSVSHNGDARLTVELGLPDQCILPFHVPASRGSAGQLLAAAIDMA